MQTLQKDWAKILLVLLWRLDNEEEGLLGFLGHFQMIRVVTVLSVCIFYMYFFLCVFTSLCRDFTLEIQYRWLLIVE